MGKFSCFLLSDKSRSAPYNILTQVRHCGALARSLTQHMKWMPSEVNNSDEESRIADNSKCKNILHLLRAGNDETPKSSKFSSSADGQTTGTGDTDAGHFRYQATTYNSVTSLMSAQCQSATRLDRNRKPCMHGENFGRKKSGMDHGLTNRLGFVHLDVPTKPSKISVQGRRELPAGLMHMVLKFGRHRSRFTPRAHRALKGGGG